MKVLKKQDVLCSKKAELVKLPDSDAGIYLKHLSFDTSQRKEGETQSDVSIRMLYECWCNKDGTPFFDSIEEAKNSKFDCINEVLIAIAEYNGIDRKGAEKALKN